MPLPRCTWKSALLYLLGVAAILFVLYAAFIALMNRTPHQRVTPQPSAFGAFIMSSQKGRVTER